MHDLLKPLCWIAGKWKSISAVVNYPHLSSPIEFSQTLSFTSPHGKPVFSYTSHTWDPKSNTPMHLENGFLHVDKDGCSVALLVAHSSGISTIEEGLAKHKTMIISTTHIGRMKFNKQSMIISFHRCYKLNEYGQLECNTMLETVRSPLTEHIKACYNRCVVQSDTEVDS